MTTSALNTLQLFRLFSLTGASCGSFPGGPRRTVAKEKYIVVSYSISGNHLAFLLQLVLAAIRVIVLVVDPDRQDFSVAVHVRS